MKLVKSEITSCATLELRSDNQGLCKFRLRGMVAAFETFFLLLDCMLSLQGSQYNTLNRDVINIHKTQKHIFIKLCNVLTQEGNFNAVQYLPSKFTIRLQQAVTKATHKMLCVILLLL